MRDTIVRFLETLGDTGWHCPVQCPCVPDLQMSQLLLTGDMLHSYIHNGITTWMNRDFKRNRLWSKTFQNVWPVTLRLSSVSNVAEQEDGRECKLQTAAWQIVAICCHLLPFVVFANCLCKLQIATGMHVTQLQTARGVQSCPNAPAFSWVGDAPLPLFCSHCHSVS